MTEKTAPPSRSRGTEARGTDARGTDAGGRRVDVRQWLGGIRLSAFTAIMLGLVVLAAFVLVPTFGTYVQQQQEIAALEEAVQLGEGEVADLEAAQDRWSDTAYITTQARERLYYVRPGEVPYLIVDDLPAADVPVEQASVSADVTAAEHDWMDRLVRSIVGAGVAETVTYEIGVPDAPVTPTPTP